jgi:ribonuclease-3
MEEEKNLEEFQKRICYHFKNDRLLYEALSHSSFANENKKQRHSNERLEFLGDSVLSIVVSDFIFEHFKHLPEGELTKIRASIVRSETLARLAKDLKLGEHLLLGRGEEMGGGRNRQTNLEDAFEAVIGAIYEDQGWETAQDYVVRQLSHEFQQASRVGEILTDYKTTFQELVHKDPEKVITYEEAGESGPPHERIFTSRVLVDGVPYGEGSGRSKKAAEQQAARAALAKWKG